MQRKISVLQYCESVFEYKIIFLSFWIQVFFQKCVIEQLFFWYFLVNPRTASIVPGFFFHFFFKIVS